MIEKYSMGLQEVRAEEENRFSVHSDPDAFMDMKVYIRSRPRQGCYSVRFYTGIVRPTGELDVDGIQDLMAEVQRMYDLLKELSAREYVPTREDLMDTTACSFMVRNTAKPILLKALTMRERYWYFPRTSSGRAAGRLKISSGMLMTGSAARLMPLGDRFAPPALGMENKLAGTAPILLGRSGMNFFRSGPKKSWRSCRRVSPKRRE